MWNKWINDDRLIRNFDDEIKKCKCKLKNDLYDKGRLLNDFDCEKDEKNRWLYKWGEVNCVSYGFKRIIG
jgi:hypothetical protein